MKINEVLSLSCDFLGLSELKSQIGSEEAGPIEKSKLELLLRCLNLAYEEILTEYLPILETETFAVKGGKISFSDFSHPISGVVSVKNLDGGRLPYTFSPGYLMVEKEKNVQVTYQIMPDKVNFGDEVQVIFPDRLLAYGTAREYLIMEGLDDGAFVYEKRFKDSLITFVRKKSLVSLPRRNWML